MLSKKTIQIVKANAYIMHKHAETIIRHFYKRMFSHNPEVIQLFNPVHLNSGKQQQALAGAIIDYATNIDNLEILSGTVELIAQKHASLMIKPKHYPIVGEHLLASIREVLGECATDDIINAWTEAYSFLADILIGREKQICDENRKKTGGWKDFKPFSIIRKEKESGNITSFYLVPTNREPLPVFKPGQYITVKVKMPNGLTTMRNYSLSDKPGLDHFRISVKREVAYDINIPEGYVSSMLHDKIKIGDTIDIAPPCGAFFIDVSEKYSRPLVLLAAGVGITPINSILLTSVDAFHDREIILVHAVLSEDVQAFRASFDALAQKHPNLKVYYRYSNVSQANASRNGFVTEAYLESLLPEHDADYYFCGPQPFMLAIYNTLMQWRIPAAQVHFEFFGPRQELEALLTKNSF